MTMYKEISNKEKRAKLLGILVARTEGRISKESAEEIINNIEDIDLKYTIKVVSDIRKAADELKLRDIHENEGREGVLEQSNILMGNIEYGFIRSYDEENEIKEPEFDTEKEFAILKRVHSWNEYNDFDTYSNYIVIYIPDGTEYKFEKNIDYILRNFNIR